MMRNTVLKGLLIAAALGLTGQATAEPAGVDKEFVGSKKCRACHSEQYNQWKDTRHAKVLRQLYTKDKHSINAPWGTEAEPKVIYTSNLDRKFTLFMIGKKYWVTIHDKFDANRDQSYQVDAVGYTAQTMFFTRDVKTDSMLNLPFNYWNESTKQERWGNSFDLFWYEEDGSLASKERRETFDQFNHHENRCAVCHMTGFEVESWKEYPKLGRSADNTNIWSGAEFGIGCEKCHGPGSKHIKSRNKADIVHPESMMDDSGSAECDQCHQSGHSINYNNGFWSELPIEFDANNPEGKGHHWTPGEGKLDEYYVANVRKKWAGTEYFQQGKSYTMQLMDTKHFENGMTCKTCHDPHTQQTRKPANDMCLECHDDGKTTKAHQGGAHVQVSANCIDCHMPYGMISFLRSTRYDGRLHVFKPIQPKETLAQFDYLKSFTNEDADPEAKLTKSWKQITADFGGCYDSIKFPKNVHYCTDFDLVPHACASCHQSERPRPGKFDDNEREKLIKAQQRYEKLLQHQHKSQDF
ncbi:multiheme c-type cytochrome [Ferrimonas lipolytica]|uniref:Cytochrome c554 and c-prime n=1 Tax=Ferrimonas lipolytica TaxID=2724191 RepID=A0A6H1U9P2_9GAMM|nr:multiheme c-type cytochrome [Ferrimonas lipolytica]QIZ75767.1 hypothetical protein HER31_01935 [Ferrimonas lipolytica]